jgi:acetolactate synthase-1/3 small subunit
MSDTKILIAYVHDRPGVLTKIAAIFYRRGLNIRTLTVGSTAKAEVSKIVFRVAGGDEELQRLMLSVDNLVDVITVDIKEDTEATARELCLARVAIGLNHSDDALRAALSRFEPRVWRHEGDSVIIEVVDAPARIDAFIATLQEFDLLDLSRTGATAIPSTHPVQEAVGFDHDNVTSMMQHVHRY